MTPAGDTASRRAEAWLRSAMAALAAAAAPVSWDAQYVLVRDVKQTTVIAAPDAAVRAVLRGRSAGMPPAVTV